MTHRFYPIRTPGFLRVQRLTSAIVAGVCVAAAPDTGRATPVVHGADFAGPSAIPVVPVLMPSPPTLPGPPPPPPAVPEPSTLSLLGAGVGFSILMSRLKRRDRSQGPDQPTES